MTKDQLYMLLRREYHTLSDGVLLDLTDKIHEQIIVPYKTTMEERLRLKDKELLRRDEMLRKYKVFSVKYGGEIS